MLRDAGYAVIGTTRSKDRAEALAALGADPVIVDVFNAGALASAVKAAVPQAVIHQLTDLPDAPGTPGTPEYDEARERNSRLRIEGTANLVAAARAADVRRLVAQSIAFAYADAPRARIESDPLRVDATGARKRTVEGVVALEKAVLGMPEGIVLRYGALYGPGTWSPDEAPSGPAIHVDAAAQAALLALARAHPGAYNIAEDHPAISSDKAKREFGFDATFRHA
jgi:nucleoside-diphosphate-sugar epimerase